MGIVASVFHRVDELADDQQGGVAGVVVDVFEALVHNAPVVGVEHVDFIALVFQNTLEHGKVHRQHLGHQEGVFLLHFLGEQESSGFVVNELCHCDYSFPPLAAMAAMRLRMRMRTAPRLLMSSIFSWV
ncbi:hypothetical protein SDC9_206497 [bioreactor metagenome]|uniref:Uncharacterized protein n=1 Tax=bioreactor metagenome TaxID=1076179 RepID=A0A645JGS2_9ZZZZ